MFEKELKFAKEAALKAGHAINEVYAGDFSVKLKSAEQPVTEADHRSNQIILDTLLGAFPNDGWLSEETQDNADRLKKNRVWIVDPLDGTKEFIGRVPEFAVSIGLSVEGEPVVGVIYNPATGELYCAGKGQGATVNDQPIKVSAQANLSQAIVLASRSESKRGEWKPYEGQFVIQQSGGMAHKMSQVACGKADASFSLTPKNEWDFCAGTIIIQEAGGSATLPNGNPLLFNKLDPLVPGILYSNQKLYLDFLKITKP